LLAPPPTAPEPEAQPLGEGIPDGEGTTVEDVVDGDTIVVSGGTRIRLIGVDTPETKDPRKPVQCFGVEASAYTSSLLASGTPVRLVYDVERLDRYGRTLAYVYRESDGLFVNAALAAGGYAVVATYPPNVAHTEEFITLARQAREAGRGLWSACGDEGTTPGPTVPAGVGTPAPVQGGGGGSGCDASYPDVCIPPGPPDLDCGDIAERRFRVLPPDPHSFDGSDDDGLGCES
jgi:micrococcal nuclease